MGKITAKEAETKAMKFVKKRHTRVRRILIRRVERKDSNDSERPLHTTSPETYNGIRRERFVIFYRADA